MTRESLHRLQQAEASYNAERYPSVPEHARAKTLYKDKTANGLTRCIVDFIRFSGGYAERVQRMGFRTKSKSGREIWVSGGGTNGTADISAIIQGRSYRIEVKIGADRMSDAQKKYESSVTRAGAVYFVARSFDSFLEWWDEVDKNQSEPV